MKIFSERIRKERQDRGKRQADVAEYIGTSVQNYSTYENNTEPSYAVLCKLADCFGVSTDYLLGRVNYRDNVQESLKSYIRYYEYKIEEARQIDPEIAVRAKEILGCSLSLLIILLNSEDLSTHGYYKHDLNANSYGQLFIELFGYIGLIIKDLDVFTEKYNRYSENERPLVSQNILREYNVTFQNHLTNLLKILLTYHEYKAEHLKIRMGLRVPDDLTEELKPFGIDPEAWENF